MFNNNNNNNPVMLSTPTSPGYSTSLHNQSINQAPLANQSILGLSMIPPPPTGSTSPLLQSPSGNKFPTGGGPIVFTPQKSSPTNTQSAPAAPTSPFVYPGRGVSSFVQSPPPYGQQVAGVIMSPPPFASTMVGSPAMQTYHQVPTSPIAHGYAQSPQYNSQPYGYGARLMGGSYAFLNSYQNQVHSSPSREDYVEPMHVSPVNQPYQQHAAQQQQQQQQPYQQQLHHRNPNSPPRPLYLPAFLTGIDAVGAVQPRPRRVFDRSPSTSPPTVMGVSSGTTTGGGGGGKSPTKSNWGTHDSIQQTGYTHGGGTNENNMAGSGGGGGGSGFGPKRSQGQGPNRQLRFADSSINQENEEKKKKSGPPIWGFGSSEEITNFLNSLLIKDGNDSVPGAAITKEAIKSAGLKSPIAESNWITVFGFPAAASSFIYSHFAQYGTIQQRKTNPGGNWLHIEYSSRLEARRALACNGKVLGGTIMVGVITSPKEIVEMYSKPDNKEEIKTHSESSVKSPTALQEKNYDTQETSSKPRTIRPLAGGTSQITSPVVGLAGSGGEASLFKQQPAQYTSPSSQLRETQNENVPMPTTSNSMITKAMEYMFGW